MCFRNSKSRKQKKKHKHLLFNFGCYIKFNFNFKQKMSNKTDPNFAYNVDAQLDSTELSKRVAISGQNSNGNKLIAPIVFQDSCFDVCAGEVLLIDKRHQKNRSSSAVPNVIANMSGADFSKWGNSAAAEDSFTTFGVSGVNQPYTKDNNDRSFMTKVAGAARLRYNGTKTVNAGEYVRWRFIDYTKGENDDDFQKDCLQNYDTSYDGSQRYLPIMEPFNPIDASPSFSGMFSAMTTPSRSGGVADVTATQVPLAQQIPSFTSKTYSSQQLAALHTKWGLIQIGLLFMKANELKSTNADALLADVVGNPAAQNEFLESVFAGNGSAFNSPWTNPTAKQHHRAVLHMLNSCSMYSVTKAQSSLIGKAVKSTGGKETTTVILSS